MVCSKRPGINENTNPEMIIRYAASEQYDGLPATGDIGVRGAM